MNIHWIIYKTTCRCNGKIYIGQHKLSGIEKEIYLGSGKLIIRAIQKYGRENFVRQIIKTCSSQELADEMETSFIIAYGSTNRKIGYNITKYAFGGHPISDGARKKIGDKLKGRKLSVEHIEKLRVRKSPRTSEHAKKISEANRGCVWIHDPIGNTSRKWKNDATIPIGWVLGRGKTQRIDRKPPTYPPNWLNNVRLANSNGDKKDKIRKTLTGHVVSDKVRQKIRESVTKYHEKIGHNTRNTVADADSGRGQHSSCDCLGMEVRGSA